MLKKISGNKLIGIIIVISIAFFLIINYNEEKMFSFNINDYKNENVNVHVSKYTANLKNNSNTDIEQDIKNNNSLNINPKINVVETKSIVKIPDAIKNEEKIVPENKNNDEENDEHVEYKENSDIIAQIESIVMASISIEWYKSGSNIIVDSSIFSPEENFILFEDIDIDKFMNISCGDIKIYAVDEFKNNKFIKTRCYITFE